MRESSFQLTKETTLQLKSQGGEKKVMKKSLSLILALAMVISMFASVAFAADASAPLDTKAKYDLLNKAGIFEGTDGGDPALDQPLTRAQFAKIITKVLNLPEDAASASIFDDLTGAGWAAGFIGAAVKAGLVDGVAPGKFDPSANVTTEQLAKLLVLGLKLQQTTDGVTGNVSAWAKGYVGAAIKENLIAASSDYTKPALRSALVDATYAAKAYVEAHNVPAKASVTEAKATGVAKVEVKFNKAVDDTKATLSLKKGSIAVATTAKFADDKKSATLTLTDVKISEGTYTVTLGGIAADQIDKASASFDAKKEEVSKISFVTASDEIAFINNAKIKVKAENQYGELASFPASSYSVFTGYTGLGETVKKDDDGFLVIQLNTNALNAGNPILTQGVSQLPITIYFNDTRVTASKTFKVSTAPFVTKIELGAAKYDGDKTSLSNAGDVATIPVKLYDQFGNPITSDQAVTVNFNQNVLPYSQNITADTQDFDSDNYYETKVTLNAKEAKSATYNVTVYAGGSSATAAFNVGAGKVATTLAFGDFNDNLTAGDTTARYIPLLAYDSEGKQLTADDIVNSTNYARIKVTVSSNVTAPANPLVQTGPHKGQIEITSVNPGTEKQTVFVTASISEIDGNDFKQTSFVIQDARVPDTLVVDTEPAKKAVLGATSDFKLIVKDQYGKKLDTLPVNYSVYVTLTNQDSTIPQITVVGQDSNAAVVGTLADGGSVTYTLAQGKQFNDGFTFDTTAGVYGKTQFKAELFKGTTSLKKVTRTIESVNPSKVDLQYALKDLGNLFAVIDSKVFPAATNGSTAAANILGKKVVITVKDSAGNDVAFPGDKVQTVSSSNGVAVQYGVGDSTPNDLGKFYVFGNKAGTSTVTATVYNAKGEVVSVSGNATVKTDAVAVDSITADNDDIDYLDATAITPVSPGVYNAYELLDLTVVDSYGLKYEDANVDASKATLGITYTVTGIKGGTVTLDSTTNQITIGAGVTEFTLTATAPNGKTATTLVYH